MFLGQCEEIHKHNYTSSNEGCPCEKNNLDSNSYVTKLDSILTLVCFSMRNHSWQSTGPSWKNQKKHHPHINNQFNYRKHFGMTNKTLIKILDKFLYISSWELPPFNVHHVGSYECVTKPGLEQSEVYLYTEDHRHPAVYSGSFVLL